MNRKRIHSKRKTVSNQSKIYSKYLKYSLKKIFEEKCRNENRRRDSHEKR